MTKCPDCGNEILVADFPDITEGDTIKCPSCGTDLEVISTDPLEVALLEEK